MDYNSLRYATLTLSNCSNTVVQKLKIYGDLVENMVEKDEGIKEADHAVIESVFRSRYQGEQEEGEGEEGTDSGEQSDFHYEKIRDHLFTVLERFFNRERVAQSEFLI